MKLASRKSGVVPSGSATRRRRRRRPADRVNTSILLRKFAELSVLAAFLGAVLSYQFMLPEGILATLNKWMLEWNSGIFPDATGRVSALVLKDLMPLLSGGQPVKSPFGIPYVNPGGGMEYAWLYGSVPILELKTTVWLMLAGITVCAHLLARSWERASGAPVLPPDHVSRGLVHNHWRLVPLLCGLFFLGWSLLSFSPMGWPPAVPDDVAKSWLKTGIADGQSLTAGGYQSLVAWVQLAAALAFLFSAEDIIRTRRFVYKILGLIFGMGVLASIVSILVQAKAPILSDIWVKWSAEDYRNDVGGFIGHNTAISSFLMAPLLIGWTLFASSRRDQRLVRFAIGVCMALMALTVLMAQSRAVIPILAVCGVLLILFLWRRASLRPALGFLVGVPLVVSVLIVTQFIQHPSNPFYRRNLPLVQRLQHLTGEHLLSETRLRILVCSLPVIREHPVAGTGWASFHYVYPQAQGAWYAANPESWILPTPKKTFRAHNEYLQTLFETGLIGSCVAVGGVIVILAGGWRHMRHSFRQRHIALQVAVFVSVLGLLLHAFFDFPFRIAPLCCTLILLLAVWSAGDRLWVIRTRGASEREDEDGGAARTALPNISEAREMRMELDLRRESTKRRKRDPVLRPGVILWYCGTTLLLAAVCAGGMAASSWFGSLVSGMRASGAINNWTGPGTIQSTPLLTTALEASKKAHALSPLNGETLFRKAEVHQFQATDLYTELVALGPGSDARENAAGLLNRTDTEIEAGLDAISRSMQEYYYHGSWRVSALFHYLEFHSTRSSLAMKDALADLERCVRMNPGDFDSTRMLIDWKRKWDPEDDRGIRNLMNTLGHYHPAYFRETYVEPVTVLMALGDNAEAYDLVVRLADADPESGLYMSLARGAAFRSGDIKQARAWNRAIPPAENADGFIFRALFLLHQGDPERALRELSGVEASQEFLVRRKRVVEKCLLLHGARMAGDTADAEALFSELVLMEEQNPGTLGEASWIFSGVADDHDTALRLLRENLRLMDEETDPVTPRALLAKELLRPYEGKLKRMLDEQADAAREGRSIPFAIEGPLRDALLEALALNKNALALFPVPARRGILEERIRREERLLGPGGAAR